MWMAQGGQPMRSSTMQVEEGQHWGLNSNGSRRVACGASKTARVEPSTVGSMAMMKRERI